jgi:hypothetical protein
MVLTVIEILQSKLPLRKRVPQADCPRCCLPNVLEINPRNSFGWMGFANTSKTWPFERAASKRSVVADCPEKSITWTIGYSASIRIAKSIPSMPGRRTSITASSGIRAADWRSSMHVPRPPVGTDLIYSFLIMMFRNQSFTPGSPLGSPPCREM